MTKTEASQVEIHVPADRLWEAFWDLEKLGPKLLPDVILSAEWIQGSGEVGSIREIRLRPDAHEAPIPIESSRDVVDSVDKDNYTFTYHTSGGSLGDLYSSYEVTTQLVPISADKTLVKHTIVFEPKDVTEQVFAIMMPALEKWIVGLPGLGYAHGSDHRVTIHSFTVTGTTTAVCGGVASAGLSRLHHTATRRRTRYCLNGFRSHVCRASHDDEFKSSRSIALGLHRRYKDVVDGGFTNLKEFVDAGVTAYAIGCTDEGMRKELLSVCELDCESLPSGLHVQLKTRVTAEEVEDCILWLCIVFLSIMCSPQPTVVRWSSSPAVSSERELKWKGFCAVIANAYYTRGMAWMPIKTLQLEQLAVAGWAEEPAVVADRMRLVFATLEIVSPQWPKK